MKAIYLQLQLLFYFKNSIFKWLLEGYFYFNCDIKLRIFDIKVQVVISEILINPRGKFI